MAEPAAMSEDMSLEETNKLRISLGLPPLAVDSEGAINHEEQAHENWANYRNEKAKEAKEKEIKERIEKSKNRKKLAEKLKGKALGEASDDEDESALNWIKKSRKREKELAAKRAKELAEMDETFEKGGAEYSAADLTGLKVAHDLSRFKDGGEIILTLKDSAILENDEGDQLTSVQIEDHERLQKNLDNKKKKPGYLAYDDDEFTLAGGQKRDILSQYDEDIDGPKKSTFIIGKDGTVSTDPMTTKKSVSEKLKAQSVNLSYDKMKEIKDYYTKDEADVTFKKPKRKKKVRKKAEDQELTDDTIGTDAAENNDGLAPMEEDDREPVANQAEVSFVDDDDLQQALARARRIANKKKEVVRLSVEDIMRTASRIRSEDRDDEDIGAASGGLVISDTSEFVNSLQEAPVIAARTLERVERTRSVTPTAQPMEEDDEDHHFSDEDVKTDNEKENGGRDVETKEMEGPPVAAVVEEEPLVSSGMAATVALLSQKGLYQQSTDEQKEKDRIGADRTKWLAEQRKKDLQREREREREKKRDKERAAAAGRGGSSRELDREKEYEASYREREKLREWEQRMVNYKPDVNLEYVDEFGRQMTTKEAFRFLSHKFHGKTSGKAKTEKRLKKLEEERRLLSMNSADTPLNMATALQERQKATGSAHVVLSVGNRGVLPPDISLSDIHSSSSTSGKGRANSGSVSTIIKEVPALVTINAPASGPAGGSGEGANALSVTGREKVAFGLKRKVTDAAVEGPLTKKKK